MKITEFGEAWNKKSAAERRAIIEKAKGIVGEGLGLQQGKDTVPLAGETFK